MIDKDVTPKNKTIMFRQESVDWLALFVSLAQLAERLAVNQIVAGSTPAGYVATVMWQAITFGFSFIIKHFFRPHYGNRLLVYKSLVRFQAPV